MGGIIAVKSNVDTGSTFSFQVKFDLCPMSMSPSAAPILEEEHELSPAIDRKMWTFTNMEDTEFTPPTPLVLNRVRSSSGASMIPSGQDVKDAFRAESPLHFLVVDDNALNKRLFARTVDNMFKKLKRAQSPVYTFASDGGQPLLPSVVQSLVSFAIVNTILVLSGLEAVEIFKKSLDDTIQGSATKPQDFDCVFMVECVH
jgi:CheY-like chemotaxis protein